VSPAPCPTNTHSLCKLKTVIRCFFSQSSFPE
jgi:hypothetical protein